MRWGPRPCPTRSIPIDFENAEANAGVSTALLDHLAAKLTISRMQRDLSDSSAIRNMGPWAGALRAGPGRGPARPVPGQPQPRRSWPPNSSAQWEVLAEAIQTVMRRYGLPEPYEQLKALTRGQSVTAEEVREFVAGLGPAGRRRSPPGGPDTGGYVGLAAELVAIGDADVDNPDLHRMTTTLSQPPPSEQAFRVEQRGIEYVPEGERWATPRDLFGMWAGASVQFEYLVYGAVLMTFGFTFGQAVLLILVGNLSYLLLGVCSLQGPEAGTTTFTINRAGFGPNGSRPIALFNWATQVGFETEGLILIVFGGIALAAKAGYQAGTPLKIVLILAAAAIQAILPFLGYATMVKVLRVLVIPFVALYVILAVLTIGKANPGSVHPGANWQTMMGGLAFTIALTGLGWVESGNDFSRYLPRSCQPEEHRGVGLRGHRHPAGRADAARRGRGHVCANRQQEPLQQLPACV